MAESSRLAVANTTYLTDFIRLSFGVSSFSTDHLPSGPTGANEVWAHGESRIGKTAVNESRGRQGVNRSNYRQKVGADDAAGLRQLRRQEAEKI
jgi:hypothetical protein